MLQETTSSASAPFFNIVPCHLRADEFHALRLNRGIVSFVGMKHLIGKLGHADGMLSGRRISTSRVVPNLHGGIRQASLAQVSRMLMDIGLMRVATPMTVNRSEIDPGLALSWPAPATPGCHSETVSNPHIRSQAGNGTLPPLTSPHILIDVALNNNPGIASIDIDDVSR